MVPENLQRLRAAVRDVPDFPKPGIVFKDITPLLSDPVLFKLVIDSFTEIGRNLKVDKVAGIDARGFLFGAPVAYLLGVGFVPVRKKGKLPYRCAEAAYQLEYGEAIVEMHIDSVLPGEKVLLVDDLLATGGTAAAAVKLIKNMGGELSSILFLIELGFLEGRRNLPGVPMEALLKL